MDAVSSIASTSTSTTTTTTTAAEIVDASSFLLRSCFSSSLSTSGIASSSFMSSSTNGSQTTNWPRRQSASAFFADLSLPSAPPPAQPNPVGAASHLKASLKPRQGRNRFARAWRRWAETQADARRRKHETSVALDETRGALEETSGVLVETSGTLREW